MKFLKVTTIFAILMFGLHATGIGQSHQSLTEVFKKHMNETVQNVKQTETADEKRAVLDESFNKMLSAIEKIEEDARLTDNEFEQLSLLKQNITEKSNQLNGIDGFDEIADEDLDDFSDYSQQDMEQANRTVTISVTTALLIIIILLLL